MKACVLCVIVSITTFPACDPEPVPVSAPEPTRTTSAPMASTKSRPRPHCVAPTRETHDGASVPLPEADKVVASLRPAFRDCYQQGLALDSSLDGCVIVHAEIAADGAVSMSDVAVRDRLTPAVGACLANAVSNAHFSGAGTLDIPVTFLQKR